MAKAKFTRQTVRAHMDKALDRIDRAIILRLRFLGEQCVNHARSTGNYIDQTGNLRSSVGYVIARRGKIIDSDFQESKGGSDGTQEGRAFAEKLAEAYPDGYVLIIVAGMNYAAAVESNGKEVLSGAEEYARQKLPQMIADLKKNVKSMAA
jgi:hypothetical protein